VSNPSFIDLTNGKQSNDQREREKKKRRVNRHQLNK